MKKVLLFLVSILIVVGVTIVLTSYKNKNVKVTIMYNDEVIKEVSVKKGTTVDELVQPEKENYTFLYYMLDNNKIEGNQKIDSDTILTAVFEKIQITYVIRFNTEGGTKIDDITVNEGDILNEVTLPEKEGYIFQYWDNNGKEFDFSVPINENITLKAVWEKKKERAKYFTVNFYTNGGSVVVPKEIETGMSIAKPNSPVKKGYTFVEWQLNGQKYNFDSPITANITLTAKWSANIYTISFNANGGSGGQTANVTATYGQAMPTISTTKPTRDGYTFDGWFDTATGGTQYYSATGASVKNWDKTSNTILYAHWTASTNTISFNANGGSGGQTANVTATYGQAMPTISTIKPAKTGYIFNGWYDASTGGTRYYSATGASVKNWDKTGNTTLYAQWTASTNTISFNANGGSGGQTANVTATYGQAMPTISTTKPTRDGYTFDGWFDTATGGTQYYSATGASVKNWDKTSNTILYAHWIVQENKIYAFLYDLGNNKRWLVLNSTGDINTDLYGSLIENYGNIINYSDPLWNIGYSAAQSITKVTIESEIKPKNTSNWFERIGATELNLTNLNTSSVTKMTSMFSNMENLISLNLGDKFDTSNVENMRYMFTGLTNLTSLNLGNKFNTSKVTDMYLMFGDMSSLTSLNLGGKFDTSKVTTMYAMFSGMESLTSLNLGSKFDTSSVIDMQYMFQNMKNITSLNLGDKFDTSSVVNMRYMFSGVSGISSLDLRNFVTNSQTRIDYIFEETTALNTIYYDSTKWLADRDSTKNWVDINN